MRISQTFVLRLWIDSDKPEEIQGTLQGVMEDKVYPFSDAQVLLHLLQRITKEGLTRASSSCNRGVKGGEESA